MVNELDLAFPDVNAYGETTGKVLKKYRIIGPVEDSDYDYDGIGGLTYNGGDIEVVVEAENEAEAFRKAYDQNDRLLSSLLEYDRRYGEGAYDDLCTVEEID